MKIKQSCTMGIAFAALLALVIGVPGIQAETKPAQPATATDAKAKKADASTEAKAKKAAAPAEAKAKKAAAPAEAKPKEAAVAEAKPKQSAPPAESKPKPAAPVEAKPKPKSAPAPAEVKGKQPAEASYTLSEKSNLRESPSRGSYSDVWLARGVKVESYHEKGSFKNGTWRHVIVKEGQKHAGSHGWLRRDWLDYKGRGK